MIVEGKFEDDHVAALNGAVGQEFFVPGAAAFEEKFVYEEVIADEQGWFHGLRGNLESLNDESGAEKSEKDGDEQGFGVFDEGGAGRFAARGRGGWERGGFDCGCFEVHRFL